MIKYVIYKTTNKTNNKSYIGFHKIREEGIIKNISETGSIFKDRYLGSGKLILRAVEKYGYENFYQEVIEIFDNKEDAELCESIFVNKDFTEREDNYNICIGGNVRITYGKNNPYFGKRHTPETLKKIKESREISNLPTYQYLIKNIVTEKIYKGFKDITDDLEISLPYHQLRIIIYRNCYEGIFKILDEERHNNAINFYKKYLEWQESYEFRHIEAKRKMSEKRKGKKQSNTHILNRVNANKKWILENPDKHIERMLKINKNPEKIEKMAAKHRGMKRSKQSCINISNSLKGKPSNNKGKIQIYNPITKEGKQVDKNYIIPEGWLRGTGPRKKEILNVS